MCITTLQTRTLIQTVAYDSFLDTRFLTNTVIVCAKFHIKFECITSSIVGMVKVPTVYLSVFFFNEYGAIQLIFQPVKVRRQFTSFVILHVFMSVSMFLALFSYMF